MSTKGRYVMQENFSDAGSSYRLSVGMVVFNKAGLVWTGYRIPKTSFEKEPTARLWQFPQGGVDAGEDLLAAAKRELLEETGMVSVELLQVRDDWLYYQLPADITKVLWDGVYCGQKQKWFAFRFTGEDTEININGDVPEFRSWQWRQLESCSDLVVEFKRDIYKKVIDGFKQWTVPLK